MNVETRGNPRISVSYDGVETGGESGCVVVLELVRIILFMLLLGVLR